MRSVRLMVATIALASSFTAVAAHAAPGASARISDFSYQLIDLNLLDGIAPSITFEPGLDYWQASGSYCFGHTGGCRSDYHFGIGQYDYQTGPGSSRVTIAPDLMQASVALDRRFDPEADIFSAVAYFNGAFVLSPWTEVRFTSAAALSVAADAYTEAGVVTHLYGWLGDMEPDTPRYFQSSMALAASGAQAGELGGSLRSGGLAEHGTFYRIASANLTRAAPVPEPSSYAMLVAGLAVLGARRLRRR